MIEPYLQRLERSAGTEAFKIANETALGHALVKSIIEDDAQPAVVVDVCKGVISTATVERITRTLDREAKRLTHGPVQRAWIQTNVAALLVWALTSVLFGASLRQLLPPTVTGDAYFHLGLAWIVLLPASIAIGYFWSRRAARRSLSEILQQTVKRSPELGIRAIFGSLGLVVIITFAMAGFAPGRPNG